MNISTVSFTKMHGLGNDFMVVDARCVPFAPSADQVRALSDRRKGVGFDQLVTIEPPRSGGMAFMGIRNADGGLVESCGNATRCVGAILLRETGLPTLTLESLGGPLVITAADQEQVCVDMGPPRLRWDEIPLARDVDPLNLPLTEGPLDSPVAVSMGNPHAVFFVDDVESVDLAKWGPLVETHPLFPNRTNVEIVQVLENGALRMRVWERGTGLTRACGTGACATLVAALLREKITRSSAMVILDGGNLVIERRSSDGHILMTGSATSVYSGVITPSGFPS